MDFVLSEGWKKAYSGAVVGLLAMAQVSNAEDTPALDARCRELEEALRQRYAGWDRRSLKASPVLGIYVEYYRRFGKTYHVMLQLESVAWKGLPIGGKGSLVRAMFMAELDSRLLTAGHDLLAVREPLGIYVARGDERYTRLDGGEQTLKEGDMYIADAEGVLSSVLYGPDARTRLVHGSRAVLYTVYAPSGISRAQVEGHLVGLEALVRLASPQAVTERLSVEAAA